MNPEKTALALRYEAGKDEAPRLVAKGSGYMADQILAIARRYGVPLREDPALVGALASLNAGDQIPTELYRSVAEILAWVYRLDKKTSGTSPGRRAR